MTKDQLLHKLLELKEKYEQSVGKVTDIWLPFELLQVIDDRDFLDRLISPVLLGETYITAFYPDEPNQIRIAFLTKLEVDDETTSTDGLTPDIE
jgi:hypothetical protein